MKQSRRHELKTNELSVFLQQVYASAKKNLNYVVGGIVVVAVILVIGLYMRSHQEAAADKAWNDYTDLMRQAHEVDKKPELLQRAATLAAEQEGKGDLGRRTAKLVADMDLDLAMNLDPVKDKAKRLDLLKDARSRYEGIMQRYSDQPATVDAARYFLAKVEESLLVAGESTKDKVLALYEPLAKATNGPYKELAAQQIKTLDERIQPIQIVATRPAEPPATAPSTGPSARPAPVQPESPGTQPAPVVPAGSTSTQPAQ